MNDEMSVVKEMCLWINKELGPDTPVHFSRFHPLYKLRSVRPRRSQRWIRCGVRPCPPARIRLHREHSGTRGGEHLLPEMQEEGDPANRIYGWRNPGKSRQVQVLRKTHPRHLESRIAQSARRLVTKHELIPPRPRISLGERVRVTPYCLPLFYAMRQALCVRL